MTNHLKIILKNRINLIIPLTNHDLKILSLNKEKLKTKTERILEKDEKSIF